MRETCETLRKWIFRSTHTHTHCTTGDAERNERNETYCKQEIRSIGKKDTNHTKPDDVLKVTEPCKCAALRQTDAHWKRKTYCAKKTKQIKGEREPNTR